MSRYYCLTIRRDWPCGLCFVSKVYSAQRKPFAPAACTLSVQAQGCTPHPPGNTQMPEAFGQSPQSLTTCWAAIACMRARSAGARLCCLGGPPNQPTRATQPRQLRSPTATVASHASYKPENSGCVSRPARVMGLFELVAALASAVGTS